MAKFTKELRQQIVKDFAVRHNGIYNPVLFLEEVRRQGKEHPAWEWFEWDDGEAAQQHRLWQAREFSSGLRVTFRIEEIRRNRTIRVHVGEMPLVHSPIETRNQGGGYVLTDPDDPGHRAEHCRQAAVGLRSWLNRYQSAVIDSGGSVEEFERHIKTLEAAGQKVHKAA